MKTALHIIGPMLAIVALAFAAATMDQVRNVSVAAIGDAAPTTETVVFDPPLYLYRDTAGHRHLSVKGPLGKCVVDSDGNFSCPSLSAIGTGAGEITLNEFPANGTNSVSWKAPDHVNTAYRLQPPADPPQPGQQLAFDTPDPLTHICVGRWVTP